jgi:hypothetical protein
LARPPASAERLEFDFRLYPPLQKVADGGDQQMVDYDGRNPARLVDVIATRGKSAQDWTEAVEIVSITKPARSNGVGEWMAAIGAEAKARCPAATQAMLAQDAGSVTFEQRAPGCAGEPISGIYRLVAGKRSWFQLALLGRQEPDGEARRQWLALLASARLAK